MEEIILTPEEIAFASDKLWGLSEEEKKTIIPHLTPMQKRFLRLNSKRGFEKYSIIQEVVWAKNCPRQAKPGGKIVYNAMGELRPKECDAFPITGYCTLAMMAMLNFTLMISDRISGGLHPQPSGIRYIRCPHTELAEGGLGTVLFKVYVMENKVVPVYDEPAFDKVR